MPGPVTTWPRLYQRLSQPRYRLSVFTLTNLVLVLLLVNGITFLLFGWDKISAEAGNWRVSESTLLGWALMGGIGGAYAGRQLFRHKTRKRSFNKSLQSIFLLQITALAVGTVYFSSPNRARSVPLRAADQPTESYFYYPNCDAARAAGAAPMYFGQAGYRDELDGDGDGIACERYYGR